MLQCSRMRNKIILKNREIWYTTRRHRRARSVRLSVGCDANVTLTVPYFVRMLEAENFLRKKAEWLLRQIDELKTINPLTPKLSYLDFIRAKSKALALARAKLEEHNRFYKLSYGKISIRDQKSRWGSCSRSGNINFNYRLVFLEDHLVDYVVVHELCHLKEMNHSERFWRLVGEVVPEYVKCRRELREKKF